MRDPELKTESFSTTRELVRFANDRKLKKEDILSVIPINGMIFLLYYD